MIDPLRENPFITGEDKVLYMLHYNRIDLSEGIDVAKSRDSKECIIFHYCSYKHGYKF